MAKMGDKIYNLRKQAGLSQEDLACEVDVTRQTVSLWEADRLVPKSEKIKKLCEIFNVSSDYFLFDGTEDREPCATDEVAACDMTDKKNSGVDNTEKPRKKNRRKIATIASVTAAVIVLLVVAMICIPQLTTPMDGVEMVTSVSVHFDPKMVLGIACFCLVAIAIVVTVLLIRAKRKKS